MKESIPVNKPRQEGVVEINKTKEIIEVLPNDLNSVFEEQEKSGNLNSFLETKRKDPSFVAHISYWGKYLKLKYRKEFESIYKEKIQPEIEKGDLPLALEKKFSPEKLEKIIENIHAIQLTHGCSKKCKFCGFDAVPGVADHTPFVQISQLFSKYGKQLSNFRPFLYFASDPSDYRSVDKNNVEVDYSALEEITQKYANYTPYISTREYKNEKWKKIIRETSEKKPVRMSVQGDKNYKIPEGVNDRNLHLYDGKIIPLGKNITKENQDESISGIGCFDGSLLTPRGIYNVLQVPVSFEHPQGQLVTPIQELADEPVKEGQSVETVLSQSIVHGKRLMAGHFDKFIRPFITFKTNTGAYDVVFDDNYKVKKVIPNVDLDLLKKQEDLVDLPQKLFDISQTDEAGILKIFNALTEGEKIIFKELFNDKKNITKEEENQALSILVKRWGKLEREIIEIRRKQKEKLGSNVFDRTEYILSPENNTLDFEYKFRPITLKKDSDGKSFLYGFAKEGVELFIYPEFTISDSINVDKMIEGNKEMFYGSKVIINLKY
ncbi:MAG: hypothetical protein WCO84_00440 [bacterium]